MEATRADRSVVLELAAIGAAALVFVATFQVRPPYLDFALAAAAVALIVLSAARSRRFWALARSVIRPVPRGAWQAAPLHGRCVVVRRGRGSQHGGRQRYGERFGNWQSFAALNSWRCSSSTSFSSTGSAAGSAPVPVDRADGRRVRGVHFRAGPSWRRPPAGSVGTHLLPLAQLCRSPYRTRAGTAPTTAFGNDLLERCCLARAVAAITARDCACCAPCSVAATETGGA
jgi:hypothetical protein